MNPTLYDVLGVSRDATREEIRQAWREAADRFEPGEGGGTRQFRLFNEAAEVLLDPERRKAYDATLPAEEPAAEGPAAEGPAAEGPAAGESTAEGTPTPRPGEAAAVVPDAPMPGSTHPVTRPGAAPTTTRQPTGQGTGQATGQPSGERAGALPTGRSAVLLAVLGVLAALAVAAGAFFGARGIAAVQEERQAEAYQEALDRAPAAAEAAAAAVLSYDHRSLEADRDAAAKFLTDKYREQYLETFDKLVSENAKAARAKVEAEVLASAAMNSPKQDPHRVPVLLFVNQTTTSASSTEPSVALNRVRFDMVEVDGTWLVDAITSY